MKLVPATTGMGRITHYQQRKGTHMIRINLLTAAAMLLPATASAQSDDFSATLTGTLTTDGWNGTEPTFTATPLTDLLYVTLTPAAGGGTASIYINGSLIGGVDPAALPASGDAFAIDYVSPYGPSMGSVTVAANGDATLLWGGQIYSEALGGAGSFSDPTAAPELSASGATGALTLLTGMLLVLVDRRRP